VKLPHRRDPDDLNNLPEQRAVMTSGRFDRIDYPTGVVR
jgi:hypothetical protein